MTKTRTRSRKKVSFKPHCWDQLEKLTQAQATIETAFAMWDGQIKFHHDGGEVLLVPGTRSRRATDRVFLKAWIGKSAFDVYADIHLLEDLVIAGGYEQDLAKLDNNSLALVCEHLLEPFIRTLEPVFGGAFMVTDASFTTTTGPRDGLYLAVKSDSGTKHGFVISVPETAVVALADKLKNSAIEKRNGRAIIVKSHLVSYRAESIHIPAEEFLALQAGDGLMLSDTWSPDNIEKIVVNNSLMAPVTRSDEGLAISGPVEKCISADAKEEQSKMKHQANMEVEISIELARARFELDELNNITEDAVLPFPTPVGSKVTLICNEERVAIGELIEIDGAFGVRIEKLS